MAFAVLGDRIRLFNLRTLHQQPLYNPEEKVRLKKGCDEMYLLFEVTLQPFIKISNCNPCVYEKTG